MTFLLCLVLSVAIADFITGLIHWWEDSYGDPRWPVLGAWVVIPNLIHHKHPRLMTKSPWWLRNNTSFLGAGALALLCFPLWGSGWFWFTIVLAALGNEVHCWAHRTPRENGALITFLQQAHIVQHPRHHARHHREPFDRNYCTLTPWVNPILERLRLWSALERVLSWVGIRTVRMSDLREGY